MNAIAIGNTNVAIKEYKGQRVVTFKDIDTVHGRPDGTARRNFNRNKEHFIEGEDFYKITPNEFRTAIGSMDKRQQNDVTLLTESGYLMLAKSFTDKVAWDVQRALVKAYFRAKQEHTPEYEQLKLEEKPYVYVDKFYKGEPVLTSADIEYFSKINRSKIDHTLRRICTENTDYRYLTRSELSEFKRENPKLVCNFSHAFVIFKSGFDKLMKHFGAAVETPKIMIEEKKEHRRQHSSISLYEYAVSLKVLSHLEKVLFEALTECRQKNKDKKIIEGFAEDIELCKKVGAHIGTLISASC